MAHFFFIADWNVLLWNLGLTLFICAGMLAAARLRSCLLTLWGVVMGLYTALLTALAIAGLPAIVNLTIDQVRTQDDVYMTLGSLALASLFCMLYYSVCVRCC